MNIDEKYSIFYFFDLLFLHSINIGRILNGYKLEEGSLNLDPSYLKFKHGSILRSRFSDNFFFSTKLRWILQFETMQFRLEPVFVDIKIQEEHGTYIRW